LLFELSLTLMKITMIHNVARNLPV